MMNYDLDRFLKAQESDYAIALAEIKSGKKRSHWMWYVFPQLRGLGRSSTSVFYGIQGMGEAKEFYLHPILGKRLKEITAVFLKLEKTDPKEILGSPDDLKLNSCLTLFNEAALSLGETDNVFARVVERFYEGRFDSGTLELLGGGR